MNRRTHLKSVAAVCLIALAASQPVVAESPMPSLDAEAQALRDLIIARVGGLDALKVPATDAEMPQPDDAQFAITDAKKRLGKFLYFDPIRSNNVRPEFGGNRAFAQTISCGSCHLGELASKAGAVSAFGMGGEGRGFVDPDSGRFVARRAAVDGLTDTMPTQVDTFDALGALTMSGRFDEVDSPFRVAPSMIGFAMNNRLFWSGPAGETYDETNPAKMNINPNDLPPQENTVEFTFKAHRMFEMQRFALQAIPAYRELFARAFPDEAAITELSGNWDDLINDDTIGRAIAAFLRSVITRNTPFDKFLDGDNSALTANQLRGATLFYQSAEDGGASCVSCHSGPAMNKTLGDEAGALIDENFHNIGLHDHPLVELAQTALNNPNFHDPGRAEATGDDADRFKFKAPTLRQLRDGAPFMHSGEFETLTDVVQYFNAGVPAADFSGNHGNLSETFSNPRGNSETGLGLSDDDVNALVDFLENGLYDPAFVTLDPTSTTETFNLNARDLTYDLQLLLLGAENGSIPSGLQHPQTDALTGQDLAASDLNATCGSIGLFGLMATLLPMLATRRRLRRR
ncbi:MAG TPA: cytochrome c peroxidase [Phycisphaerae bacterium]|nr:cytochrome c peroxidase [Phycisphaerae bacterium]HRW55174.1 cytochrome c peroxidase [Phycisphaerae bacterium]